MTPDGLRALAEAATFTRQETLDMQKPYGKWPKGLADVRARRNRAYDQLEGLGVLDLALLLADAMKALDEESTRIPPLDCTRDCAYAPCSCSGEWRRAGSADALLARLRALGDEALNTRGGTR